jgi:hypothetical protein
MICLTLNNSETAKIWGPQLAYTYVKTETSIFDGTVNFDNPKNVDIAYNVDIVNKLETLYSTFVKKGGEYIPPIVTGDRPERHNNFFSECTSTRGEIGKNSYRYFSSHVWEHIASYYNTKLNAGIELPPKPKHNSYLFNRYSELFCMFSCNNRRHRSSRVTSYPGIAMEYRDLHAPFEEYMNELAHYNTDCLNAIMRKIEIPREAMKTDCCGIKLEFAVAVDFLEYIKVVDFDDNSIREQIVKYIWNQIQVCAHEALDKAPSENELIFAKFEDNQIYEDIFKLADWLILPQAFMEWLYQQYSFFWKKQPEGYRRKNPVIFQKRHYLYGDAVCKLFGAKCKDF